MPSRKILVAGTAGFIGFHLAQRLLEGGDEVVGFDNINDCYDRNFKIVANRLSEDLMDVRAKIYTRDIFNSDS